VEKFSNSNHIDIDVESSEVVDGVDSEEEISLKKEDAS